MHIQILNLNASFDHTGICHRSIEGQSVVRVDEVVALVSGKGVDVARTLHALGYLNYEVSNIIGGITGQIIEWELAREGLHAWNFHIQSDSRINYALVDEERGRTLMINEKGPVISEAEKALYLKELGEWLKPGQILVIAGSAVQGFTAEDLREIALLAREKGMFVAVDSSGPFLAGLLRGPVDFLKINDQEFKDHYGPKYPYAFDRYEDFVSVFEAEELQHAVVTFGKRGALAYRNGEIVLGEPTRIFSDYAIGSGDSFLAGYLVGVVQKDPLAQCLLRGMACGMANTLSYGASRVTLDDVEESKKYIAIKSLG